MTRTPEQLAAAERRLEDHLTRVEGRDNTPLRSMPAGTGEPGNPRHEFLERLHRVRTKSAFGGGAGHPVYDRLYGPLDAARAQWDEFLQSAGLLPTPTLEAVRAGLSAVDGADGLVNVIGAQILAGYDSAADTTAGWVTEQSLPSFKGSPIAAVERFGRMHRLGRGGASEKVSLEVREEGWRLARYSLAFELDEMDLVDVETLGILPLALAMAGAAARALVPDLVYTLLLDNPELGDELQVFDAGRNNLGAAALADTALDAGMAAIGEQTFQDDVGDPVHVNLPARYLMVAPANLGKARRLAREMALGDGGDLVVRAESRLTTAGIVDPRDDEMIAANGTNWLLAAPPGAAPGVCVGYLRGNRQPTLRSYELSDGQWGRGFDVKFDVAACVVDGKPLYWSTGAG